MTSGWDKSPGPENHYTRGGWIGTIVLCVGIAACVAVVYALMRMVLGAPG